jgi:hypothetical protein
MFWAEYRRAVMAPKRMVTMPLSWKASASVRRRGGQEEGEEQTSEEEGDVDHAHEDADEDEAVVAHVDGLENPGGEDAQGVPDDDRAGKAEDEVDQSGEELIGADAHPNELAGGSEESDGHGVVHDLRGGGQRGAGGLTDSPKTR